MNADETTNELSNTKELINHNQFYKKMTNIEKFKIKRKPKGIYYSIFINLETSRLSFSYA